MRGVAARDEGVAEGVHEVEEARGAVGVPPCGGEGVEVSYFGRVDGRVVLEVGGGGYAAADVGGWLDRLGEGAEGGGGAEGAEGCHCWRRRRRC